MGTLKPIRKFTLLLIELFINYTGETFTSDINERLFFAVTEYVMELFYVWFMHIMSM